MAWKWYDITSYKVSVGGQNYYGGVQLFGEGFYALPMQITKKIGFVFGVSSCLTTFAAKLKKPIVEAGHTA